MFNSGPGHKLASLGIDLDNFTVAQVFRHLNFQAGAQSCRLGAGGG